MTVKNKVSMFCVFCIFAALLSCALGYSSDDFNNYLNKDNENQRIANSISSSFTTTIIIIVVIELVFLLFGICMIVMFGRKKVTPGTVLSAPPRQQSSFGPEGGDLLPSSGAQLGPQPGALPNSSAYPAVRNIEELKKLVEQGDPPPNYA